MGHAGQDFQNKKADQGVSATHFAISQEALAAPALADGQEGHCGTNVPNGAR